MNPYWSASVSYSVPLYMSGPEPVHQCTATTTAGFAVTLSGTYRYIRRLLGLAPKSVTSVSAAVGTALSRAEAAGAVSTEAASRGSSAARSARSIDRRGLLAVGRGVAGTSGSLPL